jgi:hypothetical protein
MIRTSLAAVPWRARLLHLVNRSIELLATELAPAIRKATT